VVLHDGSETEDEIGQWKAQQKRHKSWKRSEIARKPYVLQSLVFVNALDEVPSRRYFGREIKVSFIDGIASLGAPEVSLPYVEIH